VPVAFARSAALRGAFANRSATPSSAATQIARCIQCAVTRFRISTWGGGDEGVGLIRGA
jgi:hypothetical protein